jgi:gliding motility-associated-like protein
MERRRSFILAILICFSAGQVLPQKQANIWYFGNRIGMDFNGGSPAALSNSSMNTLEGCATISDTSGSLLFYTDGTDVWDRTHAPMLNGQGLKGDPSASQSGIIIPYPGDPDKYYVFTVDERLRSSPPHRGFHYSVVEMNQNGGLGMVTTKNIQLLSSVTEKVTGVGHCNSGDIWIVTHGWNNNRFYSYLVTSSGITTTPVLSAVGMVHGGIAGNSQGYMKASPDGRKIAVAMGLADIVQVFDFNTETGAVSNPVTYYYPASFQPYGLEFSSNGDLLYVASSNQGISQINLITNTTFSLTASSCQALQIAPDNKIYVGRPGSAVGTINSPDVVGAGAGFTPVALSFVRAVYEGLPTFNQSLFERGTSQFFNFSQACLGDSTSFTFTTNFPIDSVRWDFGDTASADNSSKLQNPKHLYTKSGMFEVELKIYNLNCPIPFILKKELEVLPLPEVELGEDTIICDYDQITLQLIQKNTTYFEWHDGDTASLAKTLGGPGTYFVSGQNACSTVVDVVEIEVYERIDVEIPDQYICDGDSILLDAYFPNATYLWQSGSVDSVFMVYEPGTYTVKIQTPCYFKEISVEILDDVGPPVIELGNDTTICIGDSIYLDAFYLISTYRWQNDSTSSGIWVSDSGLYYVEAKLACHSSVDSIRVDVQQLASVELTNDTSTCFNQAFVIDPITEDHLFLWQDGSTASTYIAEEEGWYTVTTRNSCNESTDSLYLAHDFPPDVYLPADTTICKYDKLILNAYVPRSTYRWQDHTTKPYYQVEKDGVYHVVVRNNCGSDREVIDIKVKDCDCTLYVPNAFSPGNDEHNNFFQVYYDCSISNYSLLIFDRWGEILYKTTHLDAKWDGRRSNGELVEPGVYVYRIDYTGLRKEEPFDKRMIGSITVIR